MVSFIDYYNAISIGRLPQKLKLEKVHDTLIIIFYVSPSSNQLQRLFSFLLKTQKNKHSSASDWWEYTKSCFKENVNIFPRNSTTQENITISRLKEDCKTYTKKKT